MAASYIPNNTEQQQRFINILWQHQMKNEFCDVTLTTNNTSIECHKLVLSSASTYFSQLFCDSDYSTDIIDVTPLPEHILRTVVAFMHKSEYVIDDENVIQLLTFSGTWNLDILAKLCVRYMDDNISINNACKFYNFALDNVDQQKSQIVNMFIREHFISLHESGQLSELTLKNFNTIIEHDEINVKNEDVIFSSAVQIINQQTSVEDINRCLELIRFPHTSGDFLVKVILNHPLMKSPTRDRYVSEALLFQINKTSTPEDKPPRYWGSLNQVNETSTLKVEPLGEYRYWGRSGIYYIGKDHSMYQYVHNNENTTCIKMMTLPTWVDEYTTVASYRERVVIFYGWIGRKRALLLDTTNNTKVTQLPDLPVDRGNTSVLLSGNDVYVIGGYDKIGNCLNSVYHLSFGRDAWQKEKSMPYAVCRPLVTRHQQCIYVLGGRNIGSVQSYVSQYNIEEDTWKRCHDMPVACSVNNAGVVIHKNRIKVITGNACLTYDDDTDTWTVKPYNIIGDRVNAFVRSGQICAAVLNNDYDMNGVTYRTFSMMRYDDVDNVWKTEHEGIDKAWYTRLFC